MKEIILLVALGSVSATSLRVMSYNLYGWNAMGTESWKKPNLWKTITASQPDVLGVQEVTRVRYDPPWRIFIIFRSLLG